MRKTGLIILTFLYLAFTAGVSVQRHYCMNRLASLRFSTHPEERCGFCGMEKQERDNACCRDEQAVYKITDDQQPVFHGFLKAPVQTDELPVSYLTFTPKAPFLTAVAPAYDHGPPGIASVPLFTRFCVFRI